MEIRDWERGDLDAVLALFYEAVHASCVGDYTQAQVDAWADGDPDREAWARSLEEHDSLVALLDGGIVGFGDIDQTGYLDRLYVHKDFQRRGVATALCDRLEARAAGRAVCVHASVTALPFFLRRGYRLVRPQTVWRKGVALRNFILEKPPGAPAGAAEKRQGGAMMNDTMLAAIVTPEKTLEVRPVPIPDFGPYEALVEMRFGATCAGTDQGVIDHAHRRPLRYPGILGHESVGRVVAVGEKATSFAVGDLITRVGAPETEALSAVWGGFAQYGVARDWQAMEADGMDASLYAKSRVNKVVPPDIPERVAPMIITWRETLSYARRIGVQSGMRVLIAGSGANALSFTEHCAYAGAEVCALGSAAREELFRRAGARAYIDYRAEDAGARLRDALPQGIDCFIDAVGYPQSASLALPLLNAGAVVGVYGWHARRDYAVNPFLAAHSFRVYCDGYDEPETHDEVVLRIREGALDASLFYDLDVPVPLREIADAYAGLRARKAVKYLIDLRAQ